MTPCTVVPSFEHTASAVFVAFGLLCREEKGRILYCLLTTHNCILFTHFQRMKLYFCQSLGLWFLLKKYFKFRNFQPQHSHKMQLIIVNTCLTLREKTGRQFDVPWEPTRSVLKLLMSNRLLLFIRGDAKYIQDVFANILNKSTKIA